MKQHIKQLLLSACTFFLFFNTHSALADTASDTETLLNWAEKTYPAIFPSHQATQNIEPWLFRYYPEFGIYAGVNKNDNSVYVLGGPWGDNPTVIDTLASLINEIDNSGGSGGIAACDTTNVLAGVTYSQSGNVVTVTSNGQCVTAPALTNTNLCQVPKQTTASGISLLSSNTITASSIVGISIPGMPSLFQDIINEAASVKHCTMNAPAATANLVVNSDLCLDITTAITGAIGSLPIDGIVITPPVNYFTKGTYTSQSVPDCFETDATTISDALTGEVWINQGGSFVKVGS
ncbi:MAG: hypothetical protein AAB376_03525 [Pseudomonadota bacterium]